MNNINLELLAVDGKARVNKVKIKNTKQIYLIFKYKKFQMTHLDVFLI